MAKVGIENLQVVHLIGDGGHKVGACIEDMNGNQFYVAVNDVEVALGDVLAGSFDDLEVIDWQNLDEGKFERNFWKRLAGRDGVTPL